MALTPAQQEASAQKREIFFQTLAETGSVTTARKACGWASRTPYYHRETNPAFRQEWDDAMAEYADNLEIEANRRGVRGVRKYLYHQGQPIYVTRMVTGDDGEKKVELVLGETGQPVHAYELQYSDPLLKVLLEGNRPGKFRNRVEMTGADGGPVKVEMSDTEKARRVAFLLSKGLAALASVEVLDDPGGDLV